MKSRPARFLAYQESPFEGSVRKVPARAGCRWCPMCTWVGGFSTTQEISNSSLEKTGYLFVRCPNEPGYLKFAATCTAKDARDEHYCGGTIAPLGRGQLDPQSPPPHAIWLLPAEVRVSLDPGFAPVGESLPRARDEVSSCRIWNQPMCVRSGAIFRRKKNSR